MSCLVATREQCCRLFKLIQNPVHFIVLYNHCTRASGRKMTRQMVPLETLVLLCVLCVRVKSSSGSQEHLPAPVLGASRSGGGG